MNDGSVLANSSVCCSFCWIERDANFVTHELSMYVLYSNISWFCNCVSLPPAIMEA